MNELEQLSELLNSDNVDYHEIAGTICSMDDSGGAVLLFFMLMHLNKEELKTVKRDIKFVLKNYDRFELYRNKIGESK